MPELAEVEYYRKQWAPYEGGVVEAIHCHGEKRIFRGVDLGAMEAALPGARFKDSWARGKQMLFCFEAGAGLSWMGLHLGMTGKLSAASAGAAVERHDHLVLDLDSEARLVFRDPRLFGRIRFDEGPEPPDWWQAIPPAILGPEFTRDCVQDFLKRHAKPPIKAVLLMQERFPGIGNWMADEILWRTRIDPRTPAGEVGPRKTTELFEAIKAVCADALRVIGTDWSKPPDDWLFNHRWKDGGRCPQTGVELRREDIGGRTTCWSTGRQTYRGVSG